MAGAELSRAAVALKAWMDAQNITQAQLAQMLTKKLSMAPGRSDKNAVNQSTISGYTRGAYTPSGLAMIALQEITDGAVKIVEWLVPAEPSPSLATGT